MRQKQNLQLNVCTSLADTYSSSQATTARGIKASPLYCVRDSGAPDSGRRAPETTHEVFPELEVASDHPEKLAK